MKYFYAALIIAAVILIIALIVCLCVHLRRKWACRKVMQLACEVKIRQLNEALDPFGFVYTPQGDLICSGMYPWQREMGFCRQYDEAAPAMYMIVDCEPIYFTYEGKHYLLEFWKGQYGCTTGGEVGLYVNTQQGHNGRPEELFYQCVGDEDRLHMSFVLYKNGKVLMERRGCHWWLTGFLPGEYSRPEELMMRISICFTSVGMRNAFYEGLLKAGYEPSQIIVEQCRITILFDKPCTKQPHKCCKLHRWCICVRNRRNCKLYRRVTRCFCSTLDKISYLGYCFPLLYRKLIKIGTKCTKRKLRRYGRRNIQW